MLRLARSSFVVSLNIVLGFSLVTRVVAAEPPLEKGWTLVGPLENPPTRTSDALPLSDQSNAAGWTVYPSLTDEFNGTELNAEIWLPYHPQWKGRQPAFFSKDNIRVADGTLQLTMRHDDPSPELAARGYEKYSSALVYAKEPVCYGYFEVRAKPMNSGGSSSFWFAGSDETLRTEIDVFEIGGRAVGFERRYNMNVHVFYSPGDKTHRSSGSIWESPWDLADDYHVYGLDWSRETIRWYVDGVVVRESKNTHCHQPLHLMFDSETMPDWMGLPRDEDLPSTYHVDYIRAWKRSGE